MRVREIGQAERHRHRVAGGGGGDVLRRKLTRVRVIPLYRADLQGQFRPLLREGGGCPQQNQREQQGEKASQPASWFHLPTPAYVLINFASAEEMPASSER